MDWFDINVDKHAVSSGSGFGIGAGFGSGNGGGVLKMRMGFTDEQMLTLRKQISCYATLSDQLLQMQKSFSAMPGLMRYGNPYFDSSVSSSGQKAQPRQRWTPTAEQLENLEQIYTLERTPCKQRIKEITAELQQHGKIGEKNVHNWFQNRKARTKRKQLRHQNPNNSESEMESEFDSRKGKMMNKPETNQFVGDNYSASSDANLTVGSPDLEEIENFLGKLDYPETLSPLHHLDDHQHSFIGRSPMDS